MKANITEKALKLLKEIDDKYDLKNEDPFIHKKIMDLFEQSVDDEPRDVDPEWFPDNGY